MQQQKISIKISKTGPLKFHEILLIPLKISSHMCSA